MTKSRKSERWQFRAQATIENGECKASRDMDGIREESTFQVAEGVLFPDVADVFRRVLLGSGKGLALIYTLSPYADEAAPEISGVNDKDLVEVDGRKREAYIVFSRQGRGKNLMCTYDGADKTMLRLGGVRDVFSLRAVPREE